MDKITIKEMLEHLNKIEKGLIHDPLCNCSVCEKEMEQEAKSLTIGLDLKEILKNG